MIDIKRKTLIIISKIPDNSNNLLKNIDVTDGDPYVGYKFSNISDSSTNRFVSLGDTIHW